MKFVEEHIAFDIMQIVYLYFAILYHQFCHHMTTGESVIFILDNSV